MKVYTSSEPPRPTFALFADRDRYFRSDAPVPDFLISTTSRKEALRMASRYADKNQMAALPVVARIERTFKNGPRQGFPEGSNFRLLLIGPGGRKTTHDISHADEGLRMFEVLEHSGSI